MIGPITQQALDSGLDHLTQRGRQTGAPLFQRTRTQRHLSGTHAPHSLKYER